MFRWPLSTCEVLADNASQFTTCFRFVASSFVHFVLDFAKPLSCTFFAPPNRSLPTMRPSSDFATCVNSSRDFGVVHHDERGGNFFGICTIGSVNFMIRRT